MKNEFGKKKNNYLIEIKKAKPKTIL